MSGLGVVGGAKTRGAPYPRLEVVQGNKYVRHGMHSSIPRVFRLVLGNMSEHVLRSIVYVGASGLVGNRAGTCAGPLP